VTAPLCFYSFGDDAPMLSLVRRDRTRAASASDSLPKGLSNAEFSPEAENAVPSVANEGFRVVREGF
jgi:hypothetical protein